MHPKTFDRFSIKWAASLVIASIVQNSVQAAFNVEEKSISDLLDAYRTGQTTVTDVVRQYINRINTYNYVTSSTPYGINAVAQVNPDALTIASQLDALRQSPGFNLANYPLFGVPVLVKNSYDAVGMVTTNGVSVLNGSGTLKSTTLMPQQDAFSVERLKQAGAIILGKATMSTMAYSFNGIDNAAGLVRNPYNPNRQPGGSSSGTGAGIASNFAMLGMGGETGGSIRIPSNANALVGLKTSIGLIDPSGTWPLTPARDVIGPMAKTVKDVAIAMNALVAPSPKNLFNGTPAYATADPGTIRPADYTAGLSTNSLQGKVLAVPRTMIPTSGSGVSAPEGTVNSTVLSAFNQALNTLRAQGATIVYVNIPATTKYYSTIGRSSNPTTEGFGYDYPTTTTGGTTPSSTWSSWAAAYYYNELIKSYNDPVIKDLNDFADALEAGRDAGAGSSLSTLNSAATNIRNFANILNAGNAKGFGDADGDGQPDNPDAIKALKAFSDLRMAEYEGFMASPNLADDPSTPDIDESSILKIDAFVAPTYGTVMPTVASNLRVPGTALDTYTGGTASLLGRFEANILGAPALSLPMGYTSDGTPMGIQFMGELLSEQKLLSFAYAFEQATHLRMAPDLSFVPEPSVLALIGLGTVFMRRSRIKA